MKAILILILLIVAALTFLAGALHVASPLDLTDAGLALWVLSRIVAAVFPPPPPPSTP